MAMRHAIADVVLPDIDTVIASVPADLAESEDELAARVRLAYAFTHATRDVAPIDSAIADLRARVVGESEEDPFGARVHAETFGALADIADRLVEANTMDVPAALAILFEAGSLAATQGRRLILFLGLNSEIRRVTWDLATAEIDSRHLDSEPYLDVAMLLMRWSELQSLAIGEGFRATERALVARDVAARRAALDELLGSTSTDGRAAARVRRLAMRYGLDPDATYRIAAILPGEGADPTPEDPGIDDADLERLARRIDGLLRRQESEEDAAGKGLRIPLALSWRGAIVAILGADRREWVRLQEAARSVLGVPPDAAPAWTAVATPAHGVRSFAGAMAELQEGLHVAEGLGRHGVIDDLAELGLERLLTSDPHLAATVVDRELGPLLGDPRMGEELVETLQVYFDAGGNRRETARRLHLADRTVAYRLERAEDLLGHGLDGEPGRRLNVALVLRRLGAATAPRLGGSHLEARADRRQTAKAAPIGTALPMVLRLARRSMTVHALGLTRRSEPRRPCCGRARARCRWPCERRGSGTGCRCPPCERRGSGTGSCSWPGERRGSDTGCPCTRSRRRSCPRRRACGRPAPGTGSRCSGWRRRWCP